MKRLGAGVLTLWAMLQLLLAVVNLVFAVALHEPLALRLLGPGEPVSPAMRQLVAAQACLANPAIIAFCALLLAQLWRTAKPDVVMVSVSLAFLQVFGFVSDAQLGGHNLAANVVSTVMVGGGLWLWARALAR